MAATALLVGLTGNIAAGKSTVAGWLEELGCHVLDLDDLNRECMRPGTTAYRQVVEAFGDGVLTPEATIDRRALGAVVFTDAQARACLESIMHPAIRALQAARVEDILSREGTSIVVVEAALLYETGTADSYDRMVVVTAPDDVRLERLLQRGLTDIEARKRMASQMDQLEKAERADYVIDNGGTLASAQAATARVAGKLLHELVAGSSERNGD